MFRADDVISAALDRNPRFKNAELPPDLVARQFNSALREVLGEVARSNPEALHETEIIPNDEVVQFDAYVDLTRGGTIEWHTIDSIDWRSNAQGTFTSPVSIGTGEARHRINHEFDHMRGPKGYLSDSQQRLQKLHGWPSVFDLRVTGIKHPERVTPQLTGIVYPWFARMGDAVALRLATLLAPVAKLERLDRQELREDYSVTIDDVKAEAKMRVTQGAQVEDFPYFHGY